MIRLLLAALLLTACAGLGPQALPSDVRIEAPSPSVAPERAAYSGKWSGHWGAQNQLSSTMVVEKIEGNTANMVYSWGTAPAWGINAPGFQRTLGTFEGNTLKTRVANGAEITYEMTPDKQTLNGRYVLAGVITMGTFKKQP